MDGRIIGKGDLFSSPPWEASPLATLVKCERKTRYLDPFHSCQEVLFSDMEVFCESDFLLFSLPWKIQQQKDLPSGEIPRHPQGCNQENESYSSNSPPFLIYLN